jgi:flagella basal body P-ring formation protein FlgA
MKIYDIFFGPRRQLFRHMFVLLTLVLLAPPLALSAQAYSSTDLTASAKQWLSVQPGADDVSSQIDIFPLDPRLPARYCVNPLTFRLVNPVLQRQNTIEVSCTDPDLAWRIYIQARWQLLIEAVQMRTALPSGSIISADVIQTGRLLQQQSRRLYLTNPEQLIGARLKKSVNAGHFLAATDLCLVCKGDLVTIEGIAQGLSVATQGVALDDGSLHESIRVRNSQSGRVISAEVIAVKKVVIRL